VRFVCVDDGVPAETVGLLHAACADRSIEFVGIQAHQFEFSPDDRCERGDLLYRPATSLVAQRVEQHLHGPGVTTFHRDPLDLYFGYVDSPLLLQRAGVPVPRSIWCTSTDRARLDRAADRLGGLPVVCKVGGFSRGVGVIVIESRRALYSTVDYLVTQGIIPLLMPFVDDALHWRVVVVGDKAVASYRNVTEDEDFRTYASAEAEDYLAPLPPSVAGVAVAATAALRVETAGVDILEHPSGRLYVLEANFPCYFAQAQQLIGVDVAGAMVQHLVAKSAAATSADE
jgi:glutathione synthase/RimK-type ligase-like ATP-grasp enzyme